MINWSQYKEKGEPESKIDWSQYKEKLPRDKNKKTDENVWANFYTGLKEGAPYAAKSGINALAQLAGKQPFENVALEENENWPRAVGRGLGEFAGYGAISAPAVMAGEAAIPGLVGASLGAGAAGGLFTEGDLKNRAVNALMSALVPGGAKATAAFGRLGKSAITRTTPRKAADIIQGAHDPQLALSKSMFENVLSESKQAGLPDVKLSKKMWSEIKELGPNTKKFKRLVEKAKAGDYEKLAKVQSDLFKKASGLEGEKTQAAKEMAQDTFELRDELNKHIHDHFIKHGREDLSQQLKEASSMYKNIKDVFYGDKRIANLVNERRDVPANINSQIMRDTAFHNRLAEEVPELKKLRQTLSDQEALKKLKGWLASGSVASAAGKYILGADHNNSRD